MLYSCSACECNEEGSEGVDCDDNSGKCNCNANIVGDKCTQCAAEHFAFSGIISMFSCGLFMAHYTFWNVHFSVEFLMATLDGLNSTYSFEST